MAGLAAGALLLAASTAARAEGDPPGRIGRIVDMQGAVSRFDHEEGRWNDAERNRPLTTGDRISTAGGARVELRVGSTTLRLGAGTELEVLRLDDERLAFQLHSGAMALRVRSREVAAEIEVVTQEARLLPMRGGHFRFDRIDDTTFAGSWRGDLRVDDGSRLTVATGQRLELFREGPARELRHVWRAVQDDAFAAWAMNEDKRDERTASARHVSPEMTGAEDLDRWGAWDRHPDYGVIWTPHEVRSDWTPYRYGRWIWVSPWGWTWVDEAPWGFAPFHYGRWVYWRSRWCWSPGTYVARPVYAPAMVAWVGGPNFRVSVNVGGPAVGWVPLAPREVYVPYYRTTPVYIDRVNADPRFQPRHGHPQQVPTGPVAYTNQGVPGAVTVVPRDVLVRREPVARAVVQVPEVQRAPGTTAPPAPVAAVVPAPVGRVAPPRDVADDGRARTGFERRGDGRDGRDAREVSPSPRIDTPRQDSPAAPVTVAPRQETAPAVNQPGTGQAPGRRGDSRDGREGRDGRGDTRPVRPVPSTPAPAATVHSTTPAAAPQQVQPAPQAQPPRHGAAPAPAVAPVVVAPAAQPAPANRAPPPRADRGGDDRRTTPPPRLGEREREASR